MDAYWVWPLLPTLAIAFCNVTVKPLGEGPGALKRRLLVDMSVEKEEKSRWISLPIVVVTRWPKLSLVEALPAAGEVRMLPLPLTAAQSAPATVAKPPRMLVAVFVEEVVMFPVAGRMKFTVPATFRVIEFNAKTLVALVLPLEFAETVEAPGLIVVPPPKVCGSRRGCPA